MVKTDNNISEMSDAEFYEKLGQLLKQGDSLKYGEMLYTTGTPDGERWDEKFYWQRIEFYREELLAEYIVNGEFMREKVEANMAAVLEKKRSPESEMTEAINEYLRSNSIAGDAYIRTIDGVEKVYITYDGHLDMIRAYIAEKGIDESMVVYEQGYDDIVYTTQPVTTYQTHSLGDINGDGSFTIADAILFQRRLLSVPDAELPDWKAADMNCDNRLDVFDFCIMKQDLVKKIPVISYIEKGTIDLTLDDVLKLAEKGEALTWSDFSNYRSTDIGSGIYIDKYDLEDDYTLLVGGIPEKSPDFILLYHHDKQNEAIDIRTADVQMYLDSEKVADAAALEADEISIEVSRISDGKTVVLENEQIKEVLDLLKLVSLNNRDDKYLASSGEYIEFELKDASGRVLGFELMASDIVIDGRGYDCGSMIYAKLKNLAFTQSSTNKKHMTKDDLIRLSKKGDALRLSDFAEFECMDAFTDDRQFAYEIEGTSFAVVIEASDPDSAPKYIFLFSVISSYSEWLDIRTEDVEAFFADPWFTVY